MLKGLTVITVFYGFCVNLNTGFCSKPVARCQRGRHSLNARLPIALSKTAFLYQQNAVSLAVKGRFSVNSSIKQKLEPKK